MTGEDTTFPAAVRIGGFTVAVTDKVAFAHPVAFSSNQRFPVSSILGSGEGKGAIIVHAGDAWTVIPPAADGSVLQISAGMPTWAPFDLASASGVVGVRHGGTGISSYSRGAMLVGAGTGMSTLEAGPEGSVLGIKGGKPTYLRVGDVTGSGDKGHLTVFSAPKTIESSRWKIVGRSLSVDGEDGFVGLGAVRFSANGESAEISTSTSHIRLTPEGEVLLSSGVTFTDDGQILHAKLPAESLTGKLPVVLGGTGLTALSPNALLFAKSSSEIGFLNVPAKDGFVLGVRNGRPSWVPHPVSRHEVKRVVIAESESEQALADTLETVKGALAFVDRSLVRRRVVLEGDDVSGTAQNVRGIVAMQNGGTGIALNQAAKGEVVFVAGARMESTRPIGRGGFLFSSGDGTPPRWERAVVAVKSGVGTTVKPLGGGIFEVDVSAESDFRWRGIHSFEGAADFLCPVTTSEVRFEPYTPEAPVVGQMWFDGSHLCFKGVSGTRRLTERLGATPPPRCVVVADVCKALHPVLDARRFRAPYRVPQGMGGDSAKWKVRRVEFWRDDLSDPSSVAELKISVDGVPLVSPNIRLASMAPIYETGDLAVTEVHSGQKIAVEPVAADDSIWTLRVTLELA
jgi:hypothetical protein